MGAGTTDNAAAGAVTAATAEYALFNIAACTGAGDCVAGGYYGGLDGGYHAMTAVATAGTWAAATERSTPVNAATAKDASASVSGIACGRGQCSAFGSYRFMGTNSVKPMVATGPGDAFGQATEVDLPANAQAPGGTRR